jgi:hypothetical protein
VFILAVVVTFVLLILPGWNTWRFYRASGVLSTQEILLQRLIGTIVHLDEFLSMSARMMAATGDARWERRYRSKEPRLDAATEEAIQLAAGSYVAAAERTAAANRNLVAMENRAFELVRQGLRDEAHDLLSSDEYERNKRAYATGMDVLTAAIDERIQRNLERSERQILGAGAVPRGPDPAHAEAGEPRDPGRGNRPRLQQPADADSRERGPRADGPARRRAVPREA